MFRHPMIAAMLAIPLCLAGTSITCAQSMPARDNRAPAPRQAATQPSGPTTLALLPPHNRAGEQEQRFVRLFNLIVGRRVARAKDLTLVSRDFLRPVMGEKAMAEAKLTKGQALGKLDRLIGADYTAYTTIDRTEANVLLTTHLIPAAETDVHRHALDMERNFPRIHTKGAVEKRGLLLDRHAERMAKHIAQSSAAATQPARALPRDLNVAALSPLVWPGRDDHNTASIAGVLTDQLTQLLAQQTPLSQVSRQHVQNIIEEKKLKLANMTVGQRARRVGRLAEADLMLISAAIKGHHAHRLEVQMLDVATGAIIMTAAEELPSGDSTTGPATCLAKRLAKQLSAGWSRIRRLEANRPINQAEAITLAVRAEDLVEDAHGPWKQRKREGKRLIRAAVAMGPKSAGVMRRAGRFYALVDQDKRAQQFYQRGLTIRPEWAELHRWLGLHLMHEMDDPEAALPYFRKADKYGGQNPEHHFYVYAKGSLGACLQELGRTEQAIRVLKKAEQNWNNQAWVYKDLAEAYKDQGNYEKAGYWFRQQASRDSMNARPWRRARQCFVKAEMPKKAARMAEMQVRRAGELRRDDWPTLLPQLAKHQPNDAASLAYRLIEIQHEPSLAVSRRTLESLGRDTTPPLNTSAIFSKEALSKRGISVHLQPYESFKYPRRARFVGQYIEDVLGIPVTTSTKRRDRVSEDYRRHLDRWDMHNATTKDLERIATTHQADRAFGLTSVQIKTGWAGIRTTSGKEYMGGNGILTTDLYSQTILSSDQTGLVKAPLEIAWLEHLAIKYAALGVAPPGQMRHECLGRRCVLRTYYGSRSLGLERMPCFACRNMLHQQHPDWPTGKTHRAPIQAGPVKPLIRDSESQILLLGIGGTAKELQLKQTARVLRATLGFQVKIESIPEAPRAYRQALTEEHSWSAIMDWLAQHVRGRDALAVCAVLNHNMHDYEPTDLYWRMRRPDMQQPNDALNQPILAVPYFEDVKRRWALPQALHQQQPAELPEGKTIRASQYANLFIGGLAAAAHNGDTCWTYGCPGTLWHDLTPFRRASPWLCEKCRAATRKLSEHS